MGNRLYCHTGHLTDSNQVLLKRGKLYDIIEETSADYCIKDERGLPHSFSKTDDKYGKSFRNWFVLYDEDTYLKQEKQEKNKVDIKLEIKYTIEAENEESMSKITQGLLSNGYVINVDEEKGKYKINIFNRKRKLSPVVYADCACQQ